MLLDQDRRPDTEVMRQLLKDTVYIKAVADPLTGYGKIDKQEFIAMVVMMEREAQYNR